MNRSIAIELEPNCSTEQQEQSVSSAVHLRHLERIYVVSTYLRFYLVL